MKKIIILFIALSMLTVLCSCGTEKSGETVPNNSVLQSDEDTSSLDDTSDTVDFSNILTTTYKVPGKSIVVDAPNYQEMETGFTELFILHGERYIAVTADKNSTANSLEEAHELAYNKFKDNIQNYSYVNSIAISNDIKENVNGIDVYKYEGTQNCGHDTVYDAYVIGYSFIMDGVPCNITGSIINEEQKQSDIDEMKSIVEAMIQTLRSER